MNKFTAAASVALALVAGSAFAADLPRARKPRLRPAAASFSWNGLYGGINIGYGFGDGSQEYGGLAYIFLASWSRSPGYFAVPGRIRPGRTSNLNGVLGGGQVGYNWQFSPWLVFGIETDIQASDVHDTVNSAASVADAFGTHLQTATSTRASTGMARFAAASASRRSSQSPDLRHRRLRLCGVTTASASRTFSPARPPAFQRRDRQYDSTSTAGPPAAASNGAHGSRPGRSRSNISMSISQYERFRRERRRQSGVWRDLQLADRFHTVRAGLNWHFNPSRRLRSSPNTDRETRGLM